MEKVSDLFSFFARSVDYFSSALLSGSWLWGQRSLSQGESDAMLLALIHFHCSSHSLSSHWYPIPNFCNSFIGSISTPFIHLNFNKLLHSVVVTKTFCSSIVMDTVLMTVHWNKIAGLVFIQCLLHDFWVLKLIIPRKITEDQMLQKGQIISLVTVPSPPFVYLQEVYPIKQLPQTLYKTSRCYDRQLGGE